MLVDYELDEKKPPDAVDELTVLLKDVVELVVFVVKSLSSSSSLSLAKIFKSYFYLSSSSRKESGSTKVLFLLTKLEVPIRKYIKL